MFDRAVITAKGLALDAKIIAGKTNAVFTAIRLGNGTYNGTEDLNAATAMKSVKQTFGISSISIAESNTVRLRSVINNVGIKEGYYISEVGIYAQDPDAGEILYSIVLGIKNKMDYQPSESELEGATSTFDTYTVISNTEKATIRMGTGAMASAEDVEELQNDLGKMKERLNKLEADVTYYVSNASGNDTTGDGSQAKPFNTLTKALNSIPKNLGGYTVSINLADGTYGTSGFGISKYYNGAIRLVGNEASPDKVIISSGGTSLTIGDNYAVKFVISGMYFRVTGSNSCVYIYNTFSVSFKNCIIEGNKTAGINWNTSLLQVTNTVFNKCNFCIMAPYQPGITEYDVNPIARVGSCTGVENGSFIRLEKGIVQLMDTIMPDTTGESTARFGSMIIQSSSAIVGALQGNVTYYVSPSGSDSTGDGTSAKPFRTIQRTLNIIPRDLGGYSATIQLADGTYDEEVNASGYDGGVLEIKSKTNPEVLSTLCKVRRIIIRNCSARVHVYGVYLTQTNGNALSVDTCAFAYIRCCQAIESAPSHHAFYFMYARARVSGCKSTGHTNCINAFHSEVSSENWASSSATEYGLFADTGSKISKSGNLLQPSGTMGAEFTQYGGMIIDQSGTISRGEMRADTSIYVSPTGSDTTGSGISTKPYKSIAYALSTISRDMGGYNATIYLADGIYDESVVINGYHSGVLNIMSQSNPEVLSTVCKVKKVTISNCTARVQVYGLYLTYTDADAFSAVTCAMVYVRCCQAIESAPTYTAFRFQYTRARMSGCRSIKHIYCVNAFHSEVSSQDWADSSAVEYGLWSDTGGKISKAGIQPGGTLAPERISNGGIIVSKYSAIIGTLQYDILLYVSPTGSDAANSGSTESSPFKTIKYALSTIPKDLGGYTAKIIIADGTYDEGIDVRGYNNGILEVKSQTNPDTLSTVCRVNKVYVSDCSARIRFYGLYLAAANVDSFVTNNCAAVFASSCQAVESAPELYGFNLSYSRVRLIACRSANHNVCVRTFFSELSSENWIDSSAIKYGISIENGSIVSKVGVQPSGTVATEYINRGGGLIIGESGDRLGTLQANKSVTTVTLTAAGWTGITAPYSQTVSVSGVTEDMEAMLLSTLEFDATQAVADAYNIAFSYITRGAASIGNGNVTFRVFNKPETDIKVGLRAI